MSEAHQVVDLLTPQSRAVTFQGEFPMPYLRHDKKDKASKLDKKRLDKTGLIIHCQSSSIVQTNPSLAENSFAFVRRLKSCITQNYKRGSNLSCFRIIRSKRKRESVNKSVNESVAQRVRKRQVENEKPKH